MVIGAAAVLLAVALGHNYMIARRNRVDFAFSGIDTMLKQRHDLVPKLVSSCERYMKHEEGVLAAVSAARERAMRAGPAERPGLEAALGTQLRSVLAVAEAYPELKASEGFDNLQRALNEVEERIGASRRAYNATVLDYNNACQMFPTNFLAVAMGLQPREMFTMPEAERAPVKVWGA